MHIPLDEKLKHPADFKVEYRFYSKEEGGRETIPYQGYRSDFWYEYPNHLQMYVFMIWPEFENTNGEVILDDKQSVQSTGIARMWVIDPLKRKYHQDKITIGLKGYFMEGSRRVAECKVIELLGLANNPILE